MRWSKVVLVLWASLLPQLALAQGTAIPQAQQQFADQNGAPLAGGSVELCVPGTACSQLKASWKDAGLTQQNPNPVLLDASGRASIFGSGTYEEHVFDVNGNQIFSGTTTAVNGAVLLGVAGGSLLGNPGSSSAPPQAVLVQPPLAFGAAGLTVLQKLVADNTNQLVDSTFANTQRYTTGTNPLTYTLSSSASLGSGFSLSIIANVATTVGTTGGDVIQNNSGGLSLAPGQVVSLVTNGAGLWFAAVSAQLATASASAGQVIQMRAQNCPPGSVPENGATLSRTTYSALFAAIGTSWGAGDGSTTFAVPNAGGQFNRGWEPGQATDSGRAFASAQADAFQGHQFNYIQPNVNSVGAGSGGIFANAGLNTAVPALTTGPVSDGQGHGTPRIAAETRPMNITALSCIGTGKVGQ